MGQNPVTKLDKVVYNLKEKLYELDFKIYKAKNKIAFEKDLQKLRNIFGLHAGVKT